jgi:hypothetical protein
MERRRSTRVAEVLLIGAIAVGSLVLWIGIPTGWLYVASHLSDRYPRIYLIALVFCPLTMIAFGVVLARLNARYVGLFPDAPDRPRRGREAWLRSVGAERSAREPLPVLEICMSISVTLAILALGVWFFFFAGSSLPNT